MLAMRRAVECLNIKYDQARVDGNRCPELENCTSIIKGDLTEAVISATSIFAKVTRDRQMIELNKLYPMYGFAKHKGYGAKMHIETLTQFGAINKHRYSFIPVKNLSL